MRNLVLRYKYEKINMSIFNPENSRVREELEERQQDFSDING